MLVSDPPDARQDAPPVHAALRPAALPGPDPQHGNDGRNDLANELLDKVKARGGTRMDVVEDFSYPIPVSVIFRVLGAPMADERKFHSWVTDFMQGADVGPEAHTEEGQAATAKAADEHGGTGFLRPRSGRAATPVSRRRACCRRCCTTTAPTARCRWQWRQSNALLLLVAGHDSTVNTITNCIMTLLRNQGSWDLVRDNPELVPRTVEEVQRLQSDRCSSSRAAGPPRTSRSPVPGSRPGRRCSWSAAAANRDPRQFDNPDRFDPMRADNEHLGFGSGIHTCFGGPLARLEINIALEIFLRRVRSPRLVVDPPPYRHNQVFRGPRHLWVDYASID